MRWFRCFLVVVTLLALGLVAASVASADELEDDARRIGRQLQCPVCNGAPVADSPSELAGQMRNVIRRKLEAGESEEQIIAYFVERYGDGVLIEPPRRGIGLAVWLGPVVGLAIGGLLLTRLLRAWLRPRWALADVPPIVNRPLHTAATNGTGANGTAPATTGAPLTAVDRARAELDRFRRES